MNDHVTIPRAEYERLIALAGDAEDLRILADFDAKLAAGEEEFIPSAMLDRMLAGASPVRVWREHRGLSQTELGRRSGVHRVGIADIEAGRSKGSIATLKALADALGVTVDDLI